MELFYGFHIVAYIQQYSTQGWVLFNGFVYVLFVFSRYIDAAWMRELLKHARSVWLFFRMR